jgi:chemotaxis protein histidine kinase CheA
MKKIFISILMLIPALTMQAQNVLTPEQQLEKAQKELEEAKKALEAAKAQAEAAKAQAEAAKVKAEAEKVKAEAEKTKAEAERLKAEAERMKQEAEKLKKNTENSVPATKLVPATKKENTTETSEGAGWVVPTMTEEVEEKKVEKTAEGVVLKEDPKYLAGAIQLNAEGKVEFVLDTQANGKSADEIYNIVFQYMSKLIKNEQNINSRIALVNRNNKNEQIIACIMDEWFVFNQSFISLDRSETKYQLVATISDNHLHLSMTRIVFNYEEGRSTGFKEPAENVITDKYALTKKKNDLAKIYGKFRRGTIDRKDQIFNDLTKLVRK